MAKLDMRRACYSGTLSTTEISYLDSVTAGTSAASKAVVLDSSSKVSALDVTALKVNGVSTAGTANGISGMQVARFTFDPTATAASRTAEAHGLGVTLPDNAIVLGGGLEILTTFTSTAGGTDKATIALMVQGANDLITATAIESGTFWDAVAWKVIVPDALAAAGVATPIKLTAAREVTATVGVCALTGGKLVGWLFYVNGA